LKNGATTIDTQTNRLDLRSWSRKATEQTLVYFLNGIRVNFRGDSLQGADYDSINFGGGSGMRLIRCPASCPALMMGRSGG